MESPQAQVLVYFENNSLKFEQDFINKGMYRKSIPILPEVDLYLVLKSFNKLKILVQILVQILVFSMEMTKNDKTFEVTR